MKWVACKGCASDDKWPMVPSDDIADGFVLEQDDIPKGFRWKYVAMGELAICRHLDPRKPLHKIIFLMKPSNRGTRGMPDRYKVL